MVYPIEIKEYIAPSDSPMTTNWIKLSNVMLKIPSSGFRINNSKKRINEK